MSLNPIRVAEANIKRKPVSSQRLRRGESDSSTYTTASENSRDMATQTTEPMPSPTHPTSCQHARMSGGAGSSDKTVSFMPSPPASPTRNPSQAVEEDFVRDKKDKSSAKADKSKRPSFRRNMSSLWKVLDPPELSHNTGVLHNLAKAEDENFRRQWDADKTTLVETISSSRQHRQRQ